MKANFIKAFNLFYSKLCEEYDTIFHTKPKVPRPKNMNSDLIIRELDRGYVEWAPVEQVSPVDWNKIEGEIGITVCEELRDYFSSLYFCALTGELNGVELTFQNVNGSSSIEELVVLCFEYGQAVFEDGKSFGIGSACFDGNDEYFIYYDNDGRLFCYDEDGGDTIELGGSLTAVISEMEAII